MSSADSSSFAKDLCIEVGIALVSASSVVPAIAIVDSAIFSNASGRESLLSSLKRGVLQAVRHPLQFAALPATRWIMLVYGGTYVVANSMELIALRAQRQRDEALLAKFVGASFANIVLSALKDKRFSGLFGVGSPRPVPPAAVALYGARDAVTVAASFVLPARVAESAVDRLGITPGVAETASQLIVPCAAQLVNTPLYILGLSLYNQGSQASLAARWLYLKQLYTPTVLARWARILPAFGLCGVINTSLRKRYSSVYRVESEPL